MTKLGIVETWRPNHNHLSHEFCTVHNILKWNATLHYLWDSQSTAADVILEGNSGLKSLWEFPLLPQEGNRSPPCAPYTTSGSLCHVQYETHSADLLNVAVCTWHSLPIDSFKCSVNRGLPCLIGESTRRAVSIMSSLWVTWHYSTAHNSVCTWRWWDIVCWCDWMFSDRDWTFRQVRRTAN